MNIWRHAYSSVYKIRLLADEVSYLTTQGEATQFVEGEYPDGIGQVTDVAVLGLFTSKHSKGMTESEATTSLVHFKETLIKCYAMGDLLKLLLI